MIADEDSRGVFELVKKMYYNKRGKATKKTGIGVKRR